MGYWRKHPKKELEALLGEFHEAGWSIDDPPTYYTVKCPCGQHLRWIHLTPSGAKYVTNAYKWLRRTEQDCKQHIAEREGDQ